MNGNWIGAAALVLGGALIAAPAARGQAAGVQAATCGPRAQVVAGLQQRFGEWRRWVALARNGRAVFELFAAHDTGTWTFLVTLPDGQSCLLAAGREFEAITRRAPAPGAPA